MDSGRYRFEFGSSSVDIQQRVDLPVAGDLTEVPAMVTADQVVYQPGTQVQPRLTVAMNDETLYTGARSDGMSVTFESDRPEVVVVAVRATSA